MEPGRDNGDVVVRLDPVHQSMFLIDTPRPQTGEIAAQPFWFSDTRDGVDFDGSHQPLHPSKLRSVMVCPVTDVKLDCAGVTNSHRVDRSSSAVSPRSACATDASRCARLAASAVRYSVSTIAS